MLSRREMLEIFEVHAQAELRGDVDATMREVSTNPVYEIHPLGLRLVGREAVREFYRRSFAGFAPKIKARRERAFGHGDNVLMTEAAYTLLGDGAEHLGRSTTVVTFDESERLVCCERTYLATPHHVALFDEALGSDFRDLPGVVYADEEVGSGIVAGGAMIRQ